MRTLDSTELSLVGGSSGTPALDAALSTALGRTAGIAATAFVSSAMIAAGSTAWAGPVSVAVGLVVGGFAAYAAIEVLDE